MIPTIDTKKKTATIASPNKLTLVRLWDYNEQEEIYKYFDDSYDRIQDWIDVLNSIEGNDYAVLGWEYIYQTEDWY